MISTQQHSKKRDTRRCPIGDSAKKGTPITGIKCEECPDYQECEMEP